MKNKTRQTQKKQPYRNSNDYLQSSTSEDLNRVAERYDVRITKAAIETIRGDVSSDPVALQYLPNPAELYQDHQDLDDPIGDEGNTAIPGIIHRYQDRVLLIAVRVCAVYCRFCFRKEKIGPSAQTLSNEELSSAIEYIRNDRNIWEVILTGGDPLIMPPKKLRQIIAQLEEIEHVKIIRFHTRIPVADPNRITQELCDVLSAATKPIYIAVHSNHEQEFSDKAQKSIHALHKAGCVLLGQTVLLKNINDNASTLDRLFRKMVENRIRPYYLHHPDLTIGTSHFRLSVEEGQKIYNEMRRSLSGIATPRYMLDIPGGYGKIDIATPMIHKDEHCNFHRVDDLNGGTHSYPPQEPLADVQDKPSEIQNTDKNSVLENSMQLVHTDTHD